MKQFLYFIFIFISFYSGSQTITIGSGSDVNSTTTASPVNIWYRRQISQIIYTSSELNTAGFFGAGDINKLGFFVATSPVYEIPGYTIKIKHTVSTNVNVAINTAGLQTVKGPYTYLPVAGGWDMITLDTPFNWNGVDNILIEICWSQITPTYNASGTCRVFPYIDGYRYDRDDAVGDICGDLTTTVLPTKPQIKFTFEEETIWTGDFSNEWTNTLNWLSGVPDETMDVVIPNTVINFPLIIDSVNLV